MDLYGLDYICIIGESIDDGVFINIIIMNWCFVFFVLV